MVSLKNNDQFINSQAGSFIVGIGASAGGLKPLEQFIEQIPSNTDIAYIIVQHLDPTQKALLPELLQRVTRMRVHEVNRNMPIEPNSVYVIQPNTNLSVEKGMLHIEKPVEPRGMRLPINILFSSLARSHGDRAIGVILSGMGSDGTLGMQAIKSVGGLTAVQQPDSAQFDSMPKSAIAAGCADIVAPAIELPSQIIRFINRVDHPTSADVDADAIDHAPESSSLQIIINQLQKRTRHDFSLYKPTTLHRRIERRMAVHNIDTLAHYADFTLHNSLELDLLFRELLIGVTSFFRDPDTWKCLINEALPSLLAQREGRDELRAWIIGCSTGEEAYTMAMAFTETIQCLPQYQNVSLKIFASDLSPDAIATARRGVYPASISNSISADRLSQFFDAHENCYQVKTSIRDMVLFAQHDVLLDPPFTKLDLISCRNLLIYFDAKLQRKLFPLFHYSLNPGSLLFLGTSETTGRFNQLFSPLNLKLRLYLRKDIDDKTDKNFLTTIFPPLSSQTKEQTVLPTNTKKQKFDNLQTAADQVLLQVYAPAAVVINKGGDIIYISGRTGKYLEPAAGKANWNFHSMIRDGLRGPVIRAMDNAISLNEPQHIHGLKVSLPGCEYMVDVSVQALDEPASLRNTLMIVFHDMGPVSARKSRRKKSGGIDEAHALELQQYKDEINSLREKARTTEEELQSANEELQSTNEELQSTNEELTTSREEMQSMNEELQTINNELQTKVDDLSLAQSDMKNLLNSIDIAILFLDQNLNVRRFTDKAMKIFNLRESDVGRPLSDLNTILQYPSLNEDAIETLRTLIFSEKKIHATDNRWFMVRIMPYCRLDNIIDGVVITLLDISKTNKS
jgi:two-component system CheB/CheR fusion protein